MNKKIILVAALMSFPALPAAAYELRKADGTIGCDPDGSECIVFCDNGERAGSMYWNGSVWTDGVKWDEDQDEEARKICEANGSECT